MKESEEAARDKMRKLIRGEEEEKAVGRSNRIWAGIGTFHISLGLVSLE